MDANKAHSKEYIALDYIQTSLKAFIGNGTHIPIQFDLRLDLKRETDILNKKILANNKIQYLYS